jgi:Nitrate and nitrite sensing
VLRNAPIRSRFAFTLIVPLLGLAVLAVAEIRSDLGESAQAARVHRLARFGAELAPVIHGLQDERSLSANHLAVGRRAGATELAAQRRAVDRTIAAYRAAARRLRLDRGDAAVRYKLDAVMDALAKLPIQRRTIDTSPITPADERVQPLIAPQERGEPPAGDVPNRLGAVREALDHYTVAIGALIQLNTAIAAGTDNQRLLDGIDAWISLLRATDFVDLQRALLYKVFAQRGFFGGAEHGRLVALNAAEDIDMAQFASFATPTQRQRLRQEVSGPHVDRAETFKRMALLQERLHRIEVDPKVWQASATVKLHRLRQVERQVSADIIATSAILEANADGVRCCMACCWPPRSRSRSTCRWSRPAR